VACYGLRKSTFFRVLIYSYLPFLPVLCGNVLLNLAASTRSFQCLLQCHTIFILIIGTISNKSFLRLFRCQNGAIRLIKSILVSIYFCRLSALFSYGNAVYPLLLCSGVNTFRCNLLPERHVIIINHCWFVFCKSRIWSLLENRLSFLRSFVDFLSSFRKMQLQLKLGHDDFHPHLSHSEFAVILSPRRLQFPTSSKLPSSLKSWCI
jgi:hypothetical protein